MATVLDISGILAYFLPIFSFLLIFGILYGILEKTQLLGKNKFVSLMASFVIAMVFLITPEASDLIRIATPWFVLLIVFIVLAMMVFLFMGVKPDSVEAFVKQPGMVWFILIVLFLIGGAAMTQVFGEQVKQITQPTNSTDSGDITQVVGKIVFHPKILGAVLLLVIASQAVRLIGK